METLLREQALNATAASATAITSTEDEETIAYKALIAAQLAEIRANYTEADAAFAEAYEELVYG